MITIDADDDPPRPRTAPPALVLPPPPSIGPPPRALEGTQLARFAPKSAAMTLSTLASDSLPDSDTEAEPIDRPRVAAAPEHVSASPVLSAALQSRESLAQRLEMQKRFLSRPLARSASLPFNSLLRANPTPQASATSTAAIALTALAPRGSDPPKRTLSFDPASLRYLSSHSPVLPHAASADSQSHSSTPGIQDLTVSPIDATKRQRTDLAPMMTRLHVACVCERNSRAESQFHVLGVFSAADAAWQAVHDFLPNWCRLRQVHSDVLPRLFRPPSDADRRLPPQRRAHDVLQYLHGPGAAVMGGVTLQVIVHPCGLNTPLFAAQTAAPNGVHHEEHNGVPTVQKPTTR